LYLVEYFCLRTRTTNHPLFSFLEVMELEEKKDESTEKTPETKAAKIKTKKEKKEKVRGKTCFEIHKNKIF
jgi:hypothetical protein